MRSALDWRCARRPGDAACLRKPAGQFAGDLAADPISVTGSHVVPLEDQLAELTALRDEGKIIGIGLSCITSGQP